jgi:hypothetical protein
MKIQPRDPNNIVTCHHRSNKNRGSPTGNLESSNPTKIFSSPRELSKVFFFAPLKQKIAKAQQQTEPRKRNSDTKI